ncbi:MAG TPA: hexitol phosphatase HxpB [Candidatus Limnocylindrales bacterium]|nr:hexitol phosphatase HxpB [Candidatus Limnocylindrales bacterium]
MIKAVIFDMDGVLIDSEPLWRKAEIRSFSTVGISLTYDMCSQTMGTRVDELVNYWYHKFPWDGTSKKQLEELIWENVIKLVREEGEMKEGVIESLEFLKKQDVMIALASSSAMVLINTVLEKLKLQDYFEVVHSAEFEDYGKPHPGVYLTTANKLGVQPMACVAIEDSISGVIAAKAAKMKCIAIPEKELLDDKRLGLADIILPSLFNINDETWIKVNK